MFSSLGARPARPRSDGYLAPGSAVCAGSTSETSTFARRGGSPADFSVGMDTGHQAQRLMASAMASALGHVWHDEAGDCNRDCWPSRIRRLGESTDPKSIQRQRKRRWSWRGMSQPKGTAREVQLGMSLSFRLSPTSGGQRCRGRTPLHRTEAIGTKPDLHTVKPQTNHSASGPYAAAISCLILSCTVPLSPGDVEPSVKVRREPT
jgi:hypothetical protein